MESFFIWLLIVDPV